MASSVLIVDDSAAMRRFVGRVLDLSGLELNRRLEAANGEEALRILGNERVDFVLTDINMPVMDGEQFLSRVEENPALRPIPVIVVSTDATACRIRRMLELGAAAYLTKPFQPEALREKVEQVLGRVDGAR